MAEKLGTSYLQRQLNQQLTIHIRKTLPGFRDELVERLRLIEDDIEHYDHFKLADSSEKTKAMFRQVNLYFDISVMKITRGFPSQDSVIPRLENVVDCMTY